MNISKKINSSFIFLASIMLASSALPKLYAAEPWEKIKAEEEFKALNLKESIEVPVLDGKRWRLANRQPDLGPELNTGKQNGCDFSVWQAKDGTWQLVSCIRHTKEIGATRLFARWEGKSLTDTDWKEKGVFSRWNPELNEGRGHLQAPHTLLIDGKYQMFYNSGGRVYQKSSDDGKVFTQVLGKSKPNITDGIGRDVCLVDVNGLWHLYACGDHRGVKCRTSKDLIEWSDAKAVAPGTESPFVFKHKDYYFLYGAVSSNNRGGIYFSRDPLDFGGPHSVQNIVHRMFNEDDFPGKPIGAEFIEHEGQEYVVWFNTPNTEKGFELGFEISKIKWVKKTPEEILKWKIENYPKYRFPTPVEEKWKEICKKSYKTYIKELEALKEKRGEMSKDEYDQATNKFETERAKSSREIDEIWGKMIDDERIELNKEATNET